MVTLSPSCESRAKYTTRMMYPVGVYRSLLRMLVLAALLSALVASDSVARQVPPGEQGTLDATVQMVYDLLRGTDEDRQKGKHSCNMCWMAIRRTREPVRLISGGDTGLVDRSCPLCGTK